MEFTNEGEPVRIRIGTASDCYWRTVETGEIVELSKERGISLGFKIKTTTGQIGSKIVETKQISVPEKQVQNDFFKELCSIKGIGKKTAMDIVQIFPDRGELKNKIKFNESLPFRDDISKILEDEYGSRK